MAALPENRLLLTGKVVSLTGRIESRLAECGAVGTGLREKTDSLGSKLSPEVVKLLAYIGSIRNRFAHEPEAEISGEEFALFEESVRMVQQELDILWPVFAKSPARGFRFRFTAGRGVRRILLPRHGAGQRLADPGGTASRPPSGLRGPSVLAGGDARHPAARPAGRRSAGPFC